MIRTTEGGTMIVKSVQQKKDENRPWVASDIAETLPNRHFGINIINRSKLAVSKPKEMKFGRLTKTPLMTIPLQNKIFFNHVNAMPFYEGEPNKN